VTERSNVVENCASNGRQLRILTLETIDNGKPIRESRAADIPYIDHFRYFAGVIRADEASLNMIKKYTSFYTSLLGLLEKSFLGISQC
jgi:aldehyde dehydrogenase (NAD+)/aldehyde dehydrogenase